MTRDQIWAEFNRRMFRSFDDTEQQTAIAWYREQRADLRARETQREQTAATILAALIQTHSGRVAEATAMSLASAAASVADALREELEPK